MKIQLSVSIWTIICFILLMLILHFLLFKPILKVMDDRKARIENAAKKKAENERLENEYASMLIEQEKALYEAQQKQIAEEIEKIRLNTKKAVEVAREERLQEVDSYRVRAREELEENLEMLNARVDELATLFADSLIKE